MTSESSDLHSTTGVTIRYALVNPASFLYDDGQRVSCVAMVLQCIVSACVFICDMNFLCLVQRSSGTTPRRQLPTRSRVGVPLMQSNHFQTVLVMVLNTNARRLSKEIHLFRARMHALSSTTGPTVQIAGSRLLLGVIRRLCDCLRAEAMAVVWLFSWTCNSFAGMSDLSSLPYAAAPVSGTFATGHAHQVQ